MSASTVIVADNNYMSARISPMPNTYGFAHFVDVPPAGTYNAIPRASEVFESANSADYTALPLHSTVASPQPSIYEVGNFQ